MPRSCSTRTRRTSGATGWPSTTSSTTTAATRSSAPLGNLLLAGGFRDVHTEIKTIHLDNREPARRKTMIAFWEQLLLSAADQLLQAGSVDEETVEGMRREFRLVQNDPNAVFFYSFVQGRATY